MEGGVLLITEEKCGTQRKNFAYTRSLTHFIDLQCIVLEEFTSLTLEFIGEKFSMKFL